MYELINIHNYFYNFLTTFSFGNLYQCETKSVHFKQDGIESSIHINFPSPLLFTPTLKYIEDLFIKITFKNLFSIENI